MTRYLTKSDIARIKQFANMPKHARTPEMLVPVDEDSVDTTQHETEQSGQRE